MNAYEIDITDRDKFGYRLDAKTYIIKAKDPATALKKVYKQVDKDFKGSGGAFAQVESLKRLATATVL